MGRSHYERIAIPESKHSPEEHNAFQTKFCHDFHAAKGKVGAEIVRTGVDHSYESERVLCLEVRGDISVSQKKLLDRYKPSLN